MGKYVVTDGWLTESWQRSMSALPILIITLFCFGLIFVRAQPTTHKSSVSNGRTTAHTSSRLPVLSAPSQSSLPTLTIDPGQPSAASNSADNSDNVQATSDIENSTSSKGNAQEQPWLARLSNRVHNFLNNSNSHK